MCNITDAVLSSTLKELMADGMLQRQSFDEIPPRVEYRLTPRGASVLPILHQVCRWAGALSQSGGAEDIPQCRKCSYAAASKQPV